jgi:DNA polymerase III subunit epsilon
MTPWHLGRLCAFDTETDSPDPLDARIISATVLWLGGGGNRDDHGWLLRTERPIPAEASAIHGISTQRADAEGVDRREGIEQIAHEVTVSLAGGGPLIAFNAAFDLTVLDRECRRVGVRTVTERLGGELLGPVVDPHVIDKAVDRFRRGKRTLGATCEHYGVDLGHAHDATADALGAARLAYILASRFPQVGESDLLALHERQVVWRAEQSASLQDYFAKQGNADTVDGSWPLRPFAEAGTS